MKKELENALKHAREYLKLYTDLPMASGFFGSNMIMQDIASGEKILENFEDSTVREIKEIIENLNSIE